MIMMLIGIFGAKHFALVTLTPKNILSVCVLMLSIMILRNPRKRGRRLRNAGIRRSRLLYEGISV